MKALIVSSAFILSCSIFTAQQWSPLPGQNNIGGFEPGGTFYTICEWEGELIFGGILDSIGDAVSKGSARFDGTQFHPHGYSTGTMRAMGVHENELFIGDHFEVSLVPNSRKLARWNGSAFFGLGNDDFSIHITDFQSYNGMMYIIGAFSEMVDVDGLLNAVAWDGDQFIEIGGVTGIQRPTVLHVYNDTLLVGGGQYLDSQGEEAFGLCYYDSENLTHAYAGGIPGIVQAMATDPVSGDLVVGGAIGAINVEEPSPVSQTARWDGEQWHRIGVGDINSEVFALCYYRDQLYAGGIFSELTRPNGDTVFVNYNMRFDGYEWQPCGQGLDGSVLDLYVWEDELYAVGGFDSIMGGPSVNSVAKWYMHPDSVTWGTEVIENDLTGLQSMNVYPNPSDQMISVQFEQHTDGELMLIDLLGREAQRWSLNGTKEEQLQIETALSGEYILVLMQNGTIVSREKIIVK